MLGFTLLAAIGLIGPAAAMWEKELHTGWNVSTGFIDPVFTSVDGEESLISHEGKRLTIDITTSGSSSQQFDFKVKNQGTVPVKIASIEESFPGLNVIVTHQGPEEDVVIDPDKSVTGTVALQVGTEAGDYHYSLELDYIQWNGFLAQLWSWWHQPLTLDIWVTVTPDQAGTAITGSSSFNQPFLENGGSSLYPVSLPADKETDLDQSDSDVTTTTSIPQATGQETVSLGENQNSTEIGDSTSANDGSSETAANSAASDSNVPSADSPAGP